jgi:hypothetical protein
MSYPNYPIQIIVLICFIFSFQGVRSQERYLPGCIVTNENDTLRGFVHIREDYSVSFFKANLRSEKKEYGPSILKTIILNDGKVYASNLFCSSLEENPIFMEVLALGSANLYTYPDHAVAHFVLKKADGKVFDFSKSGHKVFSEGKLLKYDQNKYTALLRFAFAEKWDLYPLIDQASLSESSLIEITSKYNKNFASDRKSIVYKNPLPRIKLKIGPIVGLNTSSLKFNNSFFYSHYQTISSNPYLSGGLFLNSVFPRSNTNFSLQISGEFGSSSYNATGISPANGSNEEIDISFSSLKGKGGLKYTYPKGKFRPALMISGNLISIGDVYGKITDHPEPGETDIQQFKDFMMVTNTPLVGYSVDLEIGYQGLKGRPFLNIGYDHSMGGHKITKKYFFADNLFKNDITTIHFSAGVYF